MQLYYKISQFTSAKKSALCILEMEQTENLLECANSANNNNDTNTFHVITSYTKIQALYD